VTFKWRAMLRAVAKHYPFRRGRTRIANRLIKVREGKETLAFEGFWIDVELSQLTSRLIYLFGTSEPEETKTLKSLVSRGFISMDVGANVGEYSLRLARLTGETGHVHSFEPSPECFEVLSQNVSRNGLGERVHIHKIALSDYCGTAVLQMDRDGARNTIAPNARLPEPRGEIRVPCTTVDAFVERRGIAKVDLMKIDAEGAELAILQGSRETLSRCKPVILAEVRADLSDRFSASREEIFEYMRSCGYSVYSPRGKKIPWDILERQEASNFFFLPD
jgi:FkbM family methyltransferase